MSEKKMSVIVCFNESAAAENAVILSKQHAKAFDADVHIITSFTQRSDVKEKDADKMHRADSLLEKVKQDFLDDGIKCVRFGGVSSEDH